MEANSKIALDYLHIGLKEHLKTYSVAEFLEIVEISLMFIDVHGFSLILIDFH